MDLFQMNGRWSTVLSALLPFIHESSAWETFSTTLMDIELTSFARRLLIDGSLVQLGAKPGLLFINDAAHDVCRLQLYAQLAFHTALHSFNLASTFWLNRSGC